MPAAPSPAVSPRGRVGVVWRALVAAAIGALIWATYASTIGSSDFLHVWLMIVDPVVGLLTLVGTLVWVRRYPVPVALLSALAGCFSASAAGGATLALGSVSTRRRWREILVVAAANIGGGFVLDAVYQHPDNNNTPWWVSVIIGVLATAIIVAVGVAVGQRREILANLRERAETTEREQAAREEAARVAERNRIAREMHDVLAHRISLVAMHAGALTFRQDLTPEQQATAARTIEENAHLALRELRDVLGVLREPVDGEVPPERPQPVLADLPDLVAEAKGAGMRVDLVAEVAGTPPTTVSRTAYRVVQEGLTNARKHAPDTQVSVSVTGAEGDGVTVRVTNPTALRHRSGAGMPGAGVGLLGLGERVDRVGGRISHGPGEHGGYELAVWLPWTA